MNLRAIVMTLVCAAVSIVTMYALNLTLGGPSTEDKKVEVATTIMTSDVTPATAAISGSTGSAASASAGTTSSGGSAASSGPSQQELADAAADAAEEAARSAARSAAEEAARAVVEEALANSQ